MVKDVLLPLRSRFDSQLVFLSVKSFFSACLSVNRILKTLWMHFCKIMGTVLLAAGKNHLHVGRSSKMEIVCTLLIFVPISRAGSCRIEPEVIRDQTCLVFCVYFGLYFYVPDECLLLLYWV